MKGFLRTRVFAAIAFAGVLAGACDVHGVSGPGSLASIAVSPNPQSLVVNATQQFTAAGSDFEGKAVTFSPTWSVEAGGGTISPTGLFTAGTKPGTYTSTVKATSGTMSATATVTVVVGPLATITVTPNPVTMVIGSTQTFTAVGKDASGNVVAFTPTWSVAAGGGNIDGSGLFTAGNTAGTYTNTIVASSGLISGKATVTETAGPLATVVVTPNPVILAAGATQTFTASGRDFGGNVIAIAPVWAVVAGGGTIDASTGVFTAGGTTGTYTNTVRATVGGVAGYATVIVNTGVLASIVVTPNPVFVAGNGSQQFIAAGKDGSGNDLTITPVWSVVNAAAGTITSAGGLFTAGTTAGTYVNTIKATSGTVSGFATVTVTVAVGAPILTTITVTPNPAALQTGGVQQFTAVGRDASGNIFPISPVWSVQNGGGSINSANGVFTAGNTAGTFTNTVQATSGTISGNATVIVSATPVPAPTISLGSAASNGIMAGTAFTCVIGGVINANIAISPGSTVTVFPPCVITGVQHLNDATAVQNLIDLTTTYNVLAGKPCPPANFITSNLGGTTKTAGVYCSASTIGVTGTLTLDGGGDPNATFIFQAGSSLTTAGNIVLINGAQAKNVWWQVGSSATIGTASQWQGNIVALTSITLVDNATLFGRALARNGAVSLGTNNIITLP